MRNYLVNELRLGRDAVIELIKPLVRDALRDWLSAHLSSGPRPNVSWWLSDQIRKAVQDVVREEVGKVLRTQTEVSVRVIVPVSEKAG